MAALTSHFSLPRVLSDPGQSPPGIPLPIAGLSLPRGCISEIYGPASTGRTSLLYTALAEATKNQEICALVDTDNAFDPLSAAAAGVVLHQLLWIRCGNDAESALRVTDLLVQANGFGLIVMDLADTPPRTAQRISLASWYRLRRTVEHTHTVLVVLGQAPYARQTATLALEARQHQVTWSGDQPGKLLDQVQLRIERRKPVGSPCPVAFHLTPGA
jgi:recA bacterial DNA recombination protein